MAYKPTPRWCKACKGSVLPRQTPQGGSYPCPRCGGETDQGAVHWPDGPLTPEKALELDRVHGLTDEPRYPDQQARCRVCGSRWSISLRWDKGQYLCRSCRPKAEQEGNG
jgi:hypothetical protein